MTMPLITRGKVRCSMFEKADVVSGIRTWWFTWKKERKMHAFDLLFEFMD
jgi:hypothetical protein